MMMNDDMTLAREFAASRSESAFAALVERHIGLVHTAALRQTGDPHLAEDVTQTVFLLLARKAAGLGAKTVLAAWLYRTTCYAASDALKARRRRQAREQEAYMQSTLNQPDEDAWAQLEPLLDGAMEELGETDRAALVLRFFERKTAREIAEALRLEESAAQKRVARALDKLRAIFVKRGVTLTATAIAGAVAANAVQAAPAGLAATVSATAAKGTLAAAGVGIGSKLLSMMGKSLLFSWLPPLLFLIGTLPSLALTSIIMRMERKNFRDHEGFRPQLYRRYFRQLIWVIPTMAAILILIRITATAWGSDNQLLVLICPLLILTLGSARSLTICRNRYQVWSFVGCAIMTGSLCALALGWIPLGLAKLPLLIGLAATYPLIKNRPMRMDYSLLLRAAHGMLRISDRAGDSPQSNPLEKRELLAFARFLGSLFLVNSFRWETGGLLLRLPPVGNRFLTNMKAVFVPVIGHRSSHILLGWNGIVLAHCGKADASDLAALNNAHIADPRQIELLAGKAIHQAWRDYRDGEAPAAMRALGQLPESDIFVVPSSRSKSTRWQQKLKGAFIVLLATLMIFEAWQPEWLSRWKPVNVTEKEVRAFLNDTGPNPNPKYFKPNSPALAMFVCLVLPSTNLFSPEALQVMRNDVAGSGGFNAWKDDFVRVQSVFGPPLARRAVADGWVALSDMGLSHSSASALLHTHWFNPFSLDQRTFMTRYDAWSHMRGERTTVMRLTSDGLTQLRLFRVLNCVDRIDREKIMRQITPVQVLSARSPGMPSIHEWKTVRGLFFTPSSPALQDTYFSIAALEILDGLDKIDREACIGGILGRHNGKGYFTSPHSGGFNEYHIDGSAQDTIAAYESLRILGALDRVKDLDQWQFRPSRMGVAQGQMTWHDVEAWVCRERLKEILRERKEHPQKPFGSLLESHGI